MLLVIWSPYQHVQHRLLKQ